MSPRPSPARSPSIRLLFLAANPDSTTPLHVGREVRRIRERLAGAAHPRAIEITERWAVRPADLQQALIEVQPHIVHFSGHGNADEELLLEGDDGLPRPVGPAILAKLFRLRGGGVRLVVLNACLSSPQAEAIAEHVDVAIGMQRAIGSEAAAEFSAALYHALSCGDSVRTAFESARLHLEAAGIPEHRTPRLLVRRDGVDPDGIVLLAPGWQPRPTQAEPERPLALAADIRSLGVFVGRERELTMLRAALLSDEGAPRPVAVCALHGMAGVGKSYLADKFAGDHAAQFPGGLVRLVLRPGEQEQAPSVDSLLSDIAWQLGLREALDPRQIAARLRSPRTLLHIDNADSFAAATAAAQLVRQLPRCAAIVTGRYRDLGRSVGFVQVDLSVLTEPQALELLEREMERPIAPAARAAFARLATTLGYLPLALSLAAGYLREGYSPEDFLDLFRAEDFHVSPLDPAHPALLSDQARAIVGRTFDLSLDLVRSALGREADRLLGGFFALGHAPAGGFGPGLGAAIAGLTEREFLRLASIASRHSLLERAAGDGARWMVHPLLAEMGRSRADGPAALGRMTDWFVERLTPAIDENGVVTGPRWHEVLNATAALAAWLPMIREADLGRVVQAALEFAPQHGPFAAWQRFCERALEVLHEPKDRSTALELLGYVAISAGEPSRALSAAEEKAVLDRSNGWLGGAAKAMGLIAGILQARGQLDEALRIFREEELPVFEQLGDIRERAIVLGKIASIFQARGQLDEALHILRERAMPVHEELGDHLARAITFVRIADILQARGQLDEALRIHRDEALPVFDQLGDVRFRAITFVRIADILQARGQLDEALRILREQALPVFDHLGDIPNRASTLGRIAGILHTLGELDEALRLLREQALPVFDHLGDVRARAITLGKIADILKARGQLDEALRILREEELPVFDQLGEVRERAITLGRIADILEARGQLDEALRIRRGQELPIFEQLGDVRSLLVSRTNLALALLQRDAPGDREEAREILRLASEAAMAMGIPEAAAIRSLQERSGFEPT